MLQYKRCQNSTIGGSKNCIATQGASALPHSPMPKPCWQYLNMAQNASRQEPHDPISQSLSGLQAYSNLVRATWSHHACPERDCEACRSKAVPPGVCLLL